MDKSNTASRTLICPFCSEAELRGFGRNSLRCDVCGGVLGGALLETLNKIVALPDATGGHACGSEVTPISAPVSWKSPDRSEAYWSGWLDGRYGDPKQFTNNHRLARWEDASDRLDYYRGHRAGHEARTKKIRFAEAS